MSSDSNGSPDQERHLDEVIIAYLEAVEAGQNPDRNQWLERHPDLAEELRLFFTDQDKVKRWTEPLRTVTEADDDTPPISGAQPAIGQTARGIGDYELLEEIGQGGMGVVYKARQVSLNRAVALKVARVGGPDAEADRQRFRNEAETVAHLDHPHIVPIHEVGAWEGRPYFSMKLIEGGNLAEQLDRYRADPKAAARLMALVARAVHHAHQRGVLHRDLKPSNILVDAKGQPHVTDFGLARRMEDDSGLTQSGALVGTPSYVAPEQTTNQKRAVTTASDVYGLGAVLYALLTGRPPFQADTVLDTLALVREREPQPPSQINRKVDRDLETVCLKCLQKEPDRRYGSAEALVEELERWQAGDAILARRPSWRQVAMKWARRHRGVVWSAAVTVVTTLAVLGGSVGWVLRDRAFRQAEAELPVTLATEEAERLFGQKQVREAWSAAKRAEGLLAQFGGHPRLSPYVRQLAKDLRMLVTLEDIRLTQTAVKDDHFDLAAADPAFADAFRDYGIDLNELSPAEAAARVRASRIEADLVAALDGWAMARKKFGKGEKDRWRDLLAVARSADPDPLRGRLRDMLEGKGNEVLAELSQLEKTDALSASTLNLLEVVLIQERLLLQKSKIDIAALVPLLRRAQQVRPDEFWVNHELAFVLERLTKPPQLDEAIGFYRAAIAISPKSPGVRVNLGSALYSKGRFDEAADEFREAVRLKRDYPGAHFNLGNALRAKGDVDGAIAEFREALRLKHDFPGAHYNLGSALHQKGRLDEAIDAFQAAVRLKDDDSEAKHNHYHLGLALHQKGRLDEAMEEYRAAIKLDPKYALAHNNLGAILCDGKHDYDRAADHFRRAIVFDSKNASWHHNLGNALLAKGDLGGAITAFRKALCLKQDYPEAHFQLGKALRAKGDVDGAIAEYREALRLKHDFPDAHMNLGLAFLQQNRYVAALTSLKRGHELGSLNPSWPSQKSAQLVRTAERLVVREVKLPAFVKGEYQPRDNAERLDLVAACRSKTLYLAAARLCADAFAAEPKLADDLQAGHRYNAACNAALAAAGEGQDAAQLNEKERARWRKQALDWLRADLALWAERLKRGEAEDRVAICAALERWLKDTDLASLRDPDSVTGLPQPERDACRQLWADVANMLARTNPAAVSTGETKKGP